MTWMEAALSAGITVHESASAAVTLATEGHRRRFHLVAKRRSLRPSEVDPPPTADSLLISPRLSPAARARLTDLGWSWATDTGHLHLDFAGLIVDHDPDARSTPHDPRPVAQGVGRHALLRRLLEAPADRRLRQSDLAALTGLHQSRVSRLLAHLRADGVASGGYGSWQLTDPSIGTLTDWLDTYPGPGGIATHWSGLEPVWQSTLAALRVLPADAVISGAVAADVLAPWRRPDRAVIYASRGVDLTGAGLVPVGAPADAQVTVCVPRDQTVWPSARLLHTAPGGQMVAIADPLQVLWDARQSPGPDVDEATDRLLRRVAARLRLRPEEE
ncbi:hypothetical protein [Nocardioides sp. CER19]|uniref:hypothetical protein n=1 Tax=Nocardioides sp. CER19 TaxID=3038538 RepID=UPI00244B2488|nr:hypothetical protein [Nocardioides sp. CER19]MDH2415288.1 hypothetical protein [Nocardioides sp. CER19]